MPQAAVADGATEGKPVPPVDDPAAVDGCKGDPDFAADTRGKGIGKGGKGGKGNRSQHTPKEKDRRSKAGPGSSSKPGTTKKRGSGAGNWGTPEDDILAAEQGAEDAELEMEVDALDDSLEETHGQISFEEYMKSSAALPRNYMIYMKQKDIQDAVRRFKLAANAGDAKGQFELGLCYENGDGLVQNKKEAEKWYKLAAAQGNVDAVVALAELVTIDEVDEEGGSSGGGGGGGGSVNGGT
eukprot:gene9568-16739_t